MIKPWAAQKLLEQLAYVIRQLDIANPAQTLADIQAVPEQDLEEIWKWNRTVPKSAEQCAHELIKERARVQPDAPAVCAWDGELTYSGVGPACYEAGTPTCRPQCRAGHSWCHFALEKSMWATVAMLGVLKAGGAFVSLEPSLSGATSPRYCSAGESRFDLVLCFKPVAKLAACAASNHHWFGFLPRHKQKADKHLPAVSPLSTIVCGLYIRQH